MKTCPFCAESVQDEAILCSYCGQDLRQERQSPWTTAPIVEPYLIPLLPPSPAPPAHEASRVLVRSLGVVVVVLGAGLAVVGTLLPTFVYSDGFELALVEFDYSTKRTAGDIVAWWGTIGAAVVGAVLSLAASRIPRFGAGMALGAALSLLASYAAFAFFYFEGVDPVRGSGVWVGFAGAVLACLGAALLTGSAASGRGEG